MRTAFSKKEKARLSLFSDLWRFTGRQGRRPMQPAGLQTVINVVSREEAASGEKSLWCWKPVAIGPGFPTAKAGGIDLGEKTIFYFGFFSKKQRFKKESCVFLIGFFRWQQRSCFFGKPRSFRNPDISYTLLLFGGTSTTAGEHEAQAREWFWVIYLVSYPSLALRVSLVFKNVDY